MIKPVLNKQTLDGFNDKPEGVAQRFIIESQGGLNFY